MIKIDVLVRDKNLKKYFPNPEKYLNQQAKQINFKKKLINAKKINFSILLTGNKGIGKYYFLINSKKLIKPINM